MPRKSLEERRAYTREYEIKYRADPEKLAARQAQQRAAHQRRYKADPEKYRAKGRRDYAANTKRDLARAAIWRINNPTYHRDYNRKYHYGVTPADYDALVAAHDGHCFFCKHRIIVIDHDHNNGRVRGLVCKAHNNAIRLFGDNETGVLKLLAYIRGAKP